MRLPRPPMVLALAILAAPSAAQVVHVPGTYDDLQWALNKAEPGATVIVHGGTWVSIKILKPVTILGEPAATLVMDRTNPGYAPAAITLVGPGSGTVVLSHLAIYGYPEGLFLQGSAESAITGGGFTELHLFDCDVTGAEWLPPVTGAASGTPAIDVDVDFLLLSRSHASGGRSITDDDSSCSGPSGPPGVVAPGATVIALDSTIEGGVMPRLNCLQPGGCPSGGAGGTGLIAASVFRAGSTITGGAGAALYNTFGTPYLCGTASDGAAMQVTTDEPLNGDLQQTADLRIGYAWGLSWSTTNAAVLGISVEERLAPYRLRMGPVFLDLSEMLVLQLYPAGASLYSTPVPDDPCLIGFRVTAQLNELLPIRAHVTRPVTSVIRP